MTDEYQIDNVTWAEKDSNGDIVVDTDSLDTAEVDIVSGDLESALTDASVGDTILLSQTTTHTVSSTVTIDTADLRVYGGNLALADNVDDVVVDVTADGVTLDGLTVDGNRANNTSQSGSCVRVQANDFSGYNLELNNSPRHGIHIAAQGTSFSNPTLKNIRGDNTQRDLVSLEGPNLSDPTVESVHGTNSADRGSVEVSDGVTNVHVEDVYGESQTYVVALQDHSAGEANQDVTVNHVRGSDVDSLYRSNNLTKSNDHKEITIRDVKGRGPWQSGNAPISVKNCEEVTLDDCAVYGYDDGVSYDIDAVDILQISDIRGGDNSATDDIVRVSGSSDVSVDGGHLRDGGGRGFRFTEFGTSESNLRVSNLTVNNVGSTEIEFDGDLSNCAVSNNDATVVNNLNSGFIQRAEQEFISLGAYQRSSSALSTSYTTNSNFWEHEVEWGQYTNSEGKVPILLTARITPGTDETVDIRVRNTDSSETIIEQTGISSFANLRVGPTAYSPSNPNAVETVAVEWRSDPGNNSPNIAVPRVDIGIVQS